MPQHDPGRAHLTASRRGGNAGFAMIHRAEYDWPMRWVLHGNLTPAVAEALRRHEQQPHDVSELGLAADAGAFAFFKTAQTKQRDVLTNDSSLVNALFDENIHFNRVVVFLQLEGGDVEQDDAIDRLFKRYKRLTQGRLYTVTESRVKVRQLPARL